MILKAIPGQERDIQHLTRFYNQELGFVSLPEIQSGIERRQCNVLILDNNLAGYVLYRTRKDHISTIYSIAIHPEYSERGWGAKLLRSVPAPLRLKVPVDSLANGFYYQLGMNYEGTEQGAKRALNLWSLRTHYIFCMGGNQNYYNMIKANQIAYGSRLDHLAAFVNSAYLDMLDMNWKEPDFALLMQTVEQYFPNRSIVLDYERPDQKEEMLAKVHAARAFNRPLRIIVVPKFENSVKDIPEEVTLGISIPTTYAGFLPEPNELIGKRLHFLGGSVYKHRKYRKVYEKSIVESVDSSNLEMRAKYGDTFTEYGKIDKQYIHQLQMQTLMYISMQKLKRFYGRHF